MLQWCAACSDGLALWAPSMRIILLNACRMPAACLPHACLVPAAPHPQVRATVDEPCPRCKNPVLEYYTMQLRSADEGQVCAAGAGGCTGQAGCTSWLRQGHWVWAALQLSGACLASDRSANAEPAASPARLSLLQTVFYECRKCRYRYSTNN